MPGNIWQSPSCYKFFVTAYTHTVEFVGFLGVFFVVVGGFFVFFFFLAGLELANTT